MNNFYCPNCNTAVIVESGRLCPRCSKVVIDLSKVSLSTIVRVCYAIADSKGWHDESRSFGDIIALCHSELSEALQGYRGNLTDDHLPQYRMQDVELADCIIRILDFCGENNIPLDEILVAKMLFNTTREHRHGGKIL